MVVDLSQDLEKQLHKLTDLSKWATVFLSYARADTEVARRVGAALMRADFRVFQDIAVQPGEDFQSAIQSAVDESISNGFVLVLLSPNSLTSLYCKSEIEYALRKAQASRRSNVVPVIVQEKDQVLSSLPASLATVQCFDLTSADFDQRMEELIRTLKRREMPLPEEIDSESALKKFKPPFEPRYVLLFKGHMIDAPGRREPRFPADKEKIAAEAIEKKLDELDAGPKDLALCGGECGGSLLFAEVCLKLGVRLQIRIPFDEPTFLKNSVTFAGGNWCDRYYAVKKNKLTTLFVMPEELGPTPENANPYERCNLWELHTALSMGLDKVHFICLWDGKGGDGPGGTKHMHDEVKRRGGWTRVIDTNTL